MRSRLTRVEQLDAQHPGLANDVKKWFSEGLAAGSIAAGVQKKYGVLVRPTTLGRYRNCRWLFEPASAVPEFKSEAGSANAKDLEIGRWYAGMTKIELFDCQVPGLADWVKQCFDCGLSAYVVARLLKERHGISLSENTVSYFRVSRWARERELEDTRRIEAEANAELMRRWQLMHAAEEDLVGVDK
jgi:hypothetical protein